MNKILSGVVAVLVIVASAMLWQHLRYLEVRRDRVQDQQPVFYGSDAFHAVTFFALDPGENVINAARTFVEILERSEGALVVYIGQAAFTSGSTPLSAQPWSGVVMVQYPSRATYDDVASSEEYVSAKAAFVRTYTHGMQRPQWLNIGMPQMLLLIAVSDWLGGDADALLEPMFPAGSEPESAVASQRMAAVREITDQLRAASSVNDEALLVFNLQSAGDAEQQARDGRYTSAMIARMARGKHGPMHIGAAVVLEGEPNFDNAVMVYYPGPTYFAELLESRFFQEIIGDKQLGKNLSVPTVPILRQVREATR